MSNDTYKNYTVKAYVAEQIQQSFIVEKAVVYEFESPILHYTADQLRPIILDVISRSPDAKGEMHEIVLMSLDKRQPFRVPTKIFVPADMQLLSEIQKQMQTEFSDGDPKSWVLKRKFDCISKPKPPAKAKSRVQKADPGIRPVDLSEVPEDLLFMTTQGFKEAAEVFYNDLSFVQPSSDRDWVQRRFVDGLSTWPHIERADEALGGLISEALSVVARHLHFPAWWRSIAVAMTRGNPNDVIRQCESVINFKGDVTRQQSNGEVKDLVFGA